MRSVRVYDGALWCPQCDKCPVIDYLPEQKQVVIHDPHKPGNGQFTMTVEEYNTLISRAGRIG